MYQFFVWLSNWDFMLANFWYMAYTKWYPLPSLPVPYQEYEIPKDEYSQIAVWCTDLCSTTSLCVNKRGKRVLVKRRRTNVTERASRRFSVLEPMVRMITCVAGKSWLPKVYEEYVDRFSHFLHDLDMYVMTSHETKPRIYGMNATRVVMEYKEPDPDQSLLNLVSQLYHEIEQGRFHTHVTKTTYVQSSGKIWTQEFNNMYVLRGGERDEALRFMIAWASKDWYIPMTTDKGREYLKRVFEEWSRLDRIRTGDLYTSDEPIPEWLVKVVHAIQSVKQQYAK